ncbi:hypothetical protein LOC68_24020 [Blastopirellula sp. JC732]|uniref:Carboxypeptidase regulatory-like domain-containing protein n=1 Tax=Blastopirellula sediminis TaxID=2894196 RepID=A0A9X1MTU6_9BACT|nr:hypothetical protein [Blastopirellula sediminis]MCC9605226.1 hypothetical protein [Blastopirellula sediminis]MCC9631474.1 hypothetical protein [Blastopirellula sediminis]
MKRQIIALLLAAFPLIGCQPAGPSNIAEVTGIVTVDGKPADSATITFAPAHAGKSSFGRTDDAGYYHLVYTTDIQGALIGEHTVTIANEPPPGQARPAVMVPRQYGRAGKLSANVAANQKNQIDFALTTKAK